MAAPTAVNVMLTIHEKKTTAVDLYRPLRQYNIAAYSECEAQAAEDDLQTVRQMRSDLERPPDSAHEARRDLLQSYFRALSLIEPRFPIFADRGGVSELTFTWHDAFNSSKKAALQSIHLEKAGVLFNLSAAHSQIALAADRTSQAGLKQACNSFQAAAGAFALIRDRTSTPVMSPPAGCSCAVLPTRDGGAQIW